MKSPALKTTRIRASVTVWGAGPGMGGSSYIEFVLGAAGVEVFGGGSATDGREQLGVLPASANWRDRIAFVANEAPPAHEDHVPADVRISGARGFEAALLKMAWSGPDGASAAATLLNFTDDELAAILNPDFDLPECIDLVQRLSEDVSEEELLALVRDQLRQENFSWEQLEQQLRKRPGTPR